MLEYEHVHCTDEHICGCKLSYIILPLLGSVCDPDFPSDEFAKDNFSEFWKPITEEEIRVSLPKVSSAPGPDGVRPSRLRKLQSFTLLKLLNVLLYLGRLPPRLLKSRTIFIPKKADALEPGDFRPISMTSVVTRLFHKVLAKRLSNSLYLSEEQRGFKEVDGASQNIFLLDLVLQNARLNLKETHVASIDIVKAFDSVSHNAIYSAVRALGLPLEFVSYLKHLYTGSETSFQFPGSSGISCRPSCGVRQGDPLSPLLFNMVIEFLIRKLRSFIGVTVDGVLLSTSAFADDLLLFANSHMGLQIQLDKAVDFLETCNLRINASKSFSISFLVDGKNKKLKVSELGFAIRNTPLRPLRPGDSFRYLGVAFRPDGLIFFSPVDQIKEWLSRLAKAPLKPQQRVFLLRVFLIPKLLHISVLSRIQVGVLLKADRLVRSFLRKHLDLPHDALNAFFHARINDGGLGIPSLRLLVPNLRIRRLEAVRKCLSFSSMAGFVNDFLHLHLKRATSSTLSGDVDSYWKSKMSGSVDGVGLSESGKTPGQHSWVHGANLFLNGRDFIKSVKLRFNAMPCRARCARGREHDRLCRAGCARDETLAHILQVCPRTHGQRVKRHDAVVNYAVRGLEQRGFTVYKEPRFVTSGGLRKPDFIALRGSTAHIVDAQIVSDAEPLRRAHCRKVDKYSDLPPMVASFYDVNEVTVHSLTLNWRGVWSDLSAQDLVSAGLIRKGDLPVLSSRAVIGGLAAYNFFSRTTRRAWTGPRPRRPNWSG